MTGGRWGKLRRLVAAAVAVFTPTCAVTTPASQFSPSMQAGMENGFIDRGVFHSSAVGGDLAAPASLTGLAISTADLFFRCRAESVTNERASGRQGKFMRVANQQATVSGGGWGEEGQLHSKLNIHCCIRHKATGKQVFGGEQGMRFSLVTASAEIRREMGIMML